MDVTTLCFLLLLASPLLLLLTQILNKQSVPWSTELFQRKDCLLRLCVEIYKDIMDTYFDKTSKDNQLRIMSEEDV
jgi:hypothetical protein